MDFLTIGGLILAIGAILGGQVLEGGHVSSIMQSTAALIVFGGTIGAVMVQTRIPDFILGLKLTIRAFLEKKVSMEGIINSVEEYANLARKQGILALEGKVKEIKDPYFKKGLQYVVDGTEPNAIREMMEIELAYQEEREQNGAKIYESMGGYSPTIGLIGAVLGLIHVMENLADPSALGGGIAVAFVATVYGVAAANLVFLPIFGKLKSKIRIDSIQKEMILEGVSSIAKGESPGLIREKLEGFSGGKK